MRHYDPFNIDSLRIFLVFAVPGFVSIKVYDLLVPTEKRDWANSLFEAVTYSMVNLGLMSWLIILKMA